MFWVRWVFGPQVDLLIYRVCKVLKNYLHEDLARVLGSDNHRHKILIFNMSCGDSVLGENARDNLLAK